MPDVSGPFASAAWSDGEWSRFAPAWAPSGPIGTVQASAAAGDWGFSNSGLSVSAGTGRAWVRGFGLTRTGTPPSHSVAANTHASWSRRDRLVLRRDLGAGTVTTAVKTGTAAASPLWPALTQSETGVWEEPLFSWLTPPNSGTNLTDVRDERNWVSPDGHGQLPRVMRARRETDTGSFPNNAWTSFAQDDGWVEDDPWGMRGTGATVTANKPGWYSIKGIIWFNNNSTGSRGLGFLPSAGADIGEGNGQLVRVTYVPANSGGFDTIVSGTLLDCYLPNAATVEMQGFQNSGGLLTVNYAGISAVYLGPNT